MELNKRWCRGKNSFDLYGAVNLQKLQVGCLFGASRKTRY